MISRGPGERLPVNLLLGRRLSGAGTGELPGLRLHLSLRVGVRMGRAG